MGQPKLYCEDCKYHGFVSSKSGTLIDILNEEHVGQDFCKNYNANGNIIYNPTKPINSKLFITPRTIARCKLIDGFVEATW